MSHNFRRKLPAHYFIFALHKLHVSQINIVNLSNMQTMQTEMSRPATLWLAAYIYVVFLWSQLMFRSTSRTYNSTVNYQLKNVMKFCKLPYT